MARKSRTRNAAHGRAGRQLADKLAVDADRSRLSGALHARQCRARARGAGAVRGPGAPLSAAPARGRCTKAWREAAHTIKGSASAIGAWRLARFAEMAEQVDVEAAQRCREGHREEAVAAVATATEEACRFIAACCRPPEARHCAAARLNLRDRPANTPRGRNQPRRDRPRPGRHARQRAARRKPAVPWPRSPSSSRTAASRWSRPSPA